MTAPTILCADEDRQLCRLLEKSLRGAGYRVIKSHDGDEALAALETGEVELAVLDLCLPRLDGFRLVERIRRLCPPISATPVLIMSGRRLTPRVKREAESLRVAALIAKPVPLDKLIGLVEQFVKAPTPVRPTRRKSRSKQPENRPLAGSFKELPFPQLLHHLHGMRATGVLQLDTGRKRKAIALRDGYPVAVKSNLKGECLGNLLIRWGKLDEASMRESLRRKELGEGLQGEILVAMEVLTEQEMPQALREQAEEKLFEIFGWKQGRFRFEIGKRLGRGTSLALDRSPANLIVGGIRSALPRKRVDAFLAENSERFLVPAESQFYRFQDVDLSESEQALLTQLEASPQRLGEVAGEDERLACTLYGLVVVGLLEFRSADDSSSERRVASTPRHGEATSSKPLDPEAARQLRKELAASAERLRGLDPFAALGVSVDSSRKEIEAAYVKTARSTHPDRFRSSGRAVRELADEVFQVLSTAHEVLVDPQRRERYEKERRADQRLRKGCEAGKATLEAEMQFQKGEAKLRARDYEGALACFGAALTGFPEDGQYHALYGWCLYLCHPDNEVMVQEAIEHVRRAARLAADSEKPYLYLGRLYKVIGRSADAETMFANALVISPECVEAMRELRLINLRREKRGGMLARLFRR